MEDIEVDADVRLAALRDESEGRVQAGAERRGATELQGQPHIEGGRPLGGLLSTTRRPVPDSVGIDLVHEIGGDHQRRDAEALTQIEAALEVVVMGFACSPCENSRPP